MSTQSVTLNDSTYTLIDSATTSKGTVQTLGGQLVRLIIDTSLPSPDSINFMRITPYKTESYTLTGTDNLYGISENSEVEVSFIKEA